MMGRSYAVPTPVFVQQPVMPAIRETTTTTQRIPDSQPAAPSPITAGQSPLLGPVSVAMLEEAERRRREQQAGGLGVGV